MADQPRLIVQVARGSAVDRQLSAQPPHSVTSGDVVVVVGAADVAVVATGVVGATVTGEGVGFAVVLTTTRTGLASG